MADEARPSLPGNTLYTSGTGTQRSSCNVRASRARNASGHSSQASCSFVSLAAEKSSDSCGGFAASSLLHRRASKDYCQQLPHSVSAAAGGELTERLTAAAHCFEERRGGFSRLYELDAATMAAAEALVGRRVSVWWPNEAAWFAGTVASHDAASGQHTVTYTDGDVETVWLAAERVRLALAPGEALLAPAPDALRLLASQLEAAAGTAEHGARAGGPDGNPGGLGGALGLVVWAREKGWNAWPALVVSAADAADAAPQLSRAGGGVFVRYFATWESGRLRQGEVAPFAAGLAAGCHTARCRRGVQAAFSRALDEAVAYLQDGTLPLGLDPTMDEEDEEEDGNEEDGAAAAGKAAAPADVQLPLKVASKLTLLALGCIEFLHPCFHTERRLWPVGYAAQRLAATPASGGREAPHLCEVLAAPDGSGPLFRVTPGSGAAFGLALPRVLALLRGLPDAPRCTRFVAWPGARPAAEPLSGEQQRQVEAILASLQRLPEGVRALPAAATRELACPARAGARPPSGGHGGPRAGPAAGVPTCDVCGEEEETDDNHLLQCDSCRLYVHSDCYAVRDRPEGRLWLCDVCALGPARPPACAMCPREGGALKRCLGGRWAHCACALWTPETWLDAVSGLIEGLDGIPKARWELPCSLCGQAYGACIQCAGARACTTAFHPLCARAAGATGVLGPCAGAKDVLSLSDRVAAMRRTLAQRVTCGKSAIHGWGTFAKTPHAAGDMVVEYVGALVRCSVADACERRLYNRLVGAGTYVFRLSDSLCVDATCAGNIAHLLNHSCEPNCYSRTVSLRCAATGRLMDHVVIFARRGIAAGEELTYDYRFSGEEMLPCHCGASRCRGTVNAPAAADEALALPRRCLKPWRLSKNPAPAAGMLRASSGTEISAG
ncbi:hypothetical protein WJX81_002721 [Elliptochloris bilobata]|uniref:Histone-lysine N-methyltransferase n=1 Tax=Elliptochloris bilobata TaxID=381761 RepID=A0AAW1RAH4_9CHLO